jgi:predicted transcriptional regulator of viral defense system
VTQSIILGPKENMLLFTLEAKNVSVFKIDDAQKILQTSNSSVKHILMDLTRKKRLQRIEKGTYLLVPARAGIEGHWAEEPWVIVPRLIDVYYVAFSTAMSYWRMTEQIPYIVFVATTKRKRNLEFGHQKFQFVKLSKKRFFGFVEEKRGDTTFNISSKEKTIVDGLMHPEYCGGIPEVTKAMWSIREEINWNAVLEMAKMTGVNVVVKRLGYLLSILEIENNISNLIKGEIKKLPYHFLDPVTNKKKINYSSEFGLILNRTKSELMSWRGH